MMKRIFNGHMIIYIHALPSIFSSLRIYFLIAHAFSPLRSLYMSLSHSWLSEALIRTYRVLKNTWVIESTRNQDYACRSIKHRIKGPWLIFFFFRRGRGESMQLLLKKVKCIGQILNLYMRSF